MRDEERTGHPGPEGVPHGQFDAVYASGSPAWVIGRPQPVVETLLDRGWIEAGPVLDVGCGTGENLVEIARRRSELEIVAVDSVAQAIERARSLIERVGVDTAVSLEVVDLRERIPTGPFGTVLDAGVLHVFSDEDRSGYLDRVAEALLPGGRYLVVVFSDRETRPGGPRRLSREELGRALAAAGLEVESIEDTRYLTTTMEGGARALLACARRPIPGS